MPEAILTTEYPFTITACVATEKTGIPVFAWEHHHVHHLEKGNFWKTLQKKFYPKAKAVVCLNSEEASLFQSMGCKTVVIPNFINRREKSSQQAKTFLTVGWLSKTKGIDLVPSVAERVFAKHPEWNWRIIGTGDEKGSLLKALQTKNLSDRVLVIEPTTHDLTGDYLSTSSYVMLSKFECFPMVLLEAMSHGIPCVAFDCPTGPKHIIRHGEDGLLIQENDVNEMANAMMFFIEDEHKRNVFGNNAYTNIERFSTDNILPLWKALLRK